MSRSRITVAPWAADKMRGWVVSITGCDLIPQSLADRARNSSSKSVYPPGNDTGSRRSGSGLSAWSWACSAARVSVSDRDLYHLGGAGRGRRHIVQVLLDGRLDRRDHGALHEGRLAQEHAALAIGQLLDGHLGTQHRAAQVDQHQHPLRAAHVLDGGLDNCGVGSQATVRGAAGNRNL